ncbi:preprotein translocase subunit YajC [Leadbetterella byssophila]|jgi:preprotein translocase subunit YajC|uniref:Sec translocon accessory complex subunit YajC n=1 Tax=Leadbetterella byssophila (strain DSM 17132 / JCM 16389 / KACC 11308 / NBRC 106382 / 4M15) TaxID=649349 RepID=E4RQ32_LEAB4|nr:preprotein translocase subunit YajC [Leadbetterella byssophila]ADQ16515.1 protein translocase subunit yajC [Leadbetterella byssophila DSM 17132]
MILLQAAGGGNMSFLIMMLGMFAVMYFFMIRPQQKKQKEQQKMVEDLKPGDDVITAGGLHGKVLSKDENTITLSAGGGAKLTFEKHAITKKI